MRLSTLERIDAFLEELASKLPNGDDLLADAKKSLQRATSHITGMIVFWVLPIYIYILLAGSLSV